MIEEHKQILEYGKQLKEMQQQYFFDYTLWTWEWWLLVFLAISSWFFWWFLTDKKRLKDTFLFGMFIIVCALFLDILGSTLFWWSYPLNLFGFIPSLTPVDFSLIPCFMMVIYSRVNSWKQHFIYFTTFALLASYGGENLFEWLNYYIPYTWKHIYSVVWYLMVATVGKIIIDNFTKIEKEQSK